METNDICQNRHKGNVNSKRVNPTAAFKKRDRTKVYEIIKRSSGITSKEIAEIMHRRLNCISGRISELKQAGLVIVIGRRGDCGILHDRNDFVSSQNYEQLNLIN